MHPFFLYHLLMSAFLLSLPQFAALKKEFPDVLKESCKGNWSGTLQEIPQLIIVYEICYNLPPEDSSEN